MSNIICLIFGILIGSVIVYISYHDVLKSKDDLIDDYKKGINAHNYREVRLVFINQSTKDYVRQQLDITRKKHQSEAEPNKIDDYIAAGYYTALKDVEKTITQLEKNSEGLITKEWSYV